LLLQRHGLGLRRANRVLAGAEVCALHQFLRTGRLLRATRHAGAGAISSGSHAGRFLTAAIANTSILR